VNFKKQILVLATLLLVKLSGNANAEADGPRRPFPVPRAEIEFEALTAFPYGVGRSGRVELSVYLALASPFGPLDLQVTRAKDGDEASQLKNIYLGVSGAILKIDTPKLANSFHCGPECTQQRKARALKNLQQVREIVSIFLKAQNVSLVAQGYNDSRFRVNNTFVLGPWVREAVPSANMGFVPSGQWNEFSDLDEYFAKSHTIRAEVMQLVDGLKRTSFAAIERNGATTVRVFLTGIGDNVAGLLFQAGDTSPPVLRANPADGLDYIILEEVESGLWYFETT
jgi:hypothetical protein